MAEHPVAFKIGHIKRESPLIVNQSLFSNSKKHTVSTYKNWRNTPINQRFQRCVVKASYSKNLSPTSWAAHGRYLQREHAKHKKEEPGHGFSATDSQVNLSEQLKEWQEGGDPYLFKFIIAPENGHLIDLKKFTHHLMDTINSDQSHQLKWMAIDHHDTDHKHVHLLISGKDKEGRVFRFDKDYLKNGIRQRCNELLTNELGLRTDISIVQFRERQIDKNYFTSIDQRLLHHSQDNIVDFSVPAKVHPMTRVKRLQEIARLQYLTVLGLSEQVSHKRWKLDSNLHQKLKKMQFENDIIKSKHQELKESINHPKKIDYKIIGEGQFTTPLIGRVIGMEKQWLLIDNVDGDVYKVFADKSILKWREKGIIKNGDLISLHKAVFVTHKGEEKNVIKVKKYKSILHFLKKSEDPHFTVFKEGMMSQKNYIKREFAKSCFSAWIEFQRQQKLNVLRDK